MIELASGIFIAVVSILVTGVIYSKVEKIIRVIL